MAAITDSYQSGGILFPQSYPREFDDEELDEGDIVKSKPSGKANSYRPLVNDVSYTEEPPRQRLDSGGDSGVCVHQEQRDDQTPVPAVGAQGGGSKPPNGRIPLAVGITTHHEPTGVSRAGSGAPMELLSDQNRSWASREEDERDTSPSDEERDGKGLDDSTTALLRRYTMERNGRPTSIHLSPSGEIVGSGWLSEILISGHKKCSVTLEEDSITWRFLSRKDGEVWGELGGLIETYAVECLDLEGIIGMWTTG